MGNKDKKKHTHRSRSRDRSYDTKHHRSDKSDRRKESKTSRKRSSASSDYSESRSRSSSPGRKRNKHKHRSRSPVEKQWKHKHRHASPSDLSDDSSSDHRSSKKSKLREEEMALLKAEAKKQKEIRKAIEAPEEKRARRLAKKEAKERKRKQKMGWDQEYMGYTNVDNPFGDEHLLDTFTWSKKMEKEGTHSLNKEEINDIQKRKMDDNRRELEKVKKRRLERERELEERDREREQLQRDKEAEYYREWEKQEDTFHLQQAKLRSEIRIQDGRAKPIDLLAKYISTEDDELAVEMHEPYTYLYGLTIVDLEDLLEDIKVYLELEQGRNTEYWRDIVVVTEDELAKLRKLESNSAVFRDRREGINESVSDEVSAVFKGKSTGQLLLLDDQIKKKLAGGEGVDVGYWESLLQQLKAHMAKTRLRETHQDVLRQKLFRLKQEQGIQSEALFPSGILREDTPRGTPERREGTPTIQTGQGTVTESNEVKQEGDTQQPGTSQEGVAGPSHDDQDEPVLTEEDLIAEGEEEQEEEDQGIVDYLAGSYSPKLTSEKDLDIDAVVYDPADDMKKLELARIQVSSTGKVRLDHESEFEKKAREGMDNDEAQFSVEFKLDQQSFMWADKYRPRKPRFFNRVHTGFEWNKYNQTHYDIDNPPPKIVQGYKFNIFYPDLIDKTQTPEYTVTPVPENPDFGVLKFHAGPPYEDIAFKVVNKEWEHSYKRGFRCQFANNIMQLWFHFKRYRYRR